MTSVTPTITAAAVQAQASPAPLICFSHLRWDFVLQRPQHLIGRFAADRRVIFWEEMIPVDHHLPFLEFHAFPGTTVQAVRPRVPRAFSPEETERALARLLDQMLALTLLGLFAHLLPEVPSRLDVQTGRRLVEDDELGLADQGHGEAQPLLLTTGTLLDLGSRDVGQIPFLDHLSHVIARAVCGGNDLEGLAHREVGQETTALEDDTDTATACRVLRSVAEDRHRAVGRCDHPQDHVDGGALAGPVGAQHCDDAAGWNGQADVVDGSER